MKRKNVKLEWYVIRRDFNTNKIKYNNIFITPIVDGLINNCVKKKINNYMELREFLEREFRYYYMSRCECEVLVGGLFTKYEEFEKWDMWLMIKPNIDRICEYVIRELKLDEEAFKKCK